VSVAGGPPGQPRLHKKYSTNGPAITDERAPALEGRAYRMMSALISAVAGDSAFQAAVKGPGAQIPPS
jgi:hypothetical protein